MLSSNNTTLDDSQRPIKIPHYGQNIHILATIAFLIGICGNLSALWILYKSARTRNRKHVLMLRWLASNDLLAVVGMLSSIYLKRIDVIPDYFCCGAFVVIRGFAIGSGTVALVMAMERWMALTRPFLYHKIVTYDALKRTLATLWVAALLLTYMPLFGFGLWYDWSKPNHGCVRFRYAETLSDRIYAFIFFGVGTMLSIIIALCNISVVWELSKIRLQNRVLVRRISKSLIVNNRTNSSCPRHHQTPEEVAFSKLMVYICIIFMVCWWPQLVSIVAAQVTNLSKRNPLYILADLLLSAYFILDPYIYVLQRSVLDKTNPAAANSKERTTLRIASQN